jgi:hypothetical protein
MTPTVTDGPVYELRIYTAAEGKLEALKARFRDYVIALFSKHGMESIGFWVPQEPERSNNTLIYILRHPNKATVEKIWVDFQADPEWQKVKKESEANGPLATKIERVWLEPTEFSALK